MGRSLSRVPGPKGMSLAEDLNYKTIKEDWNEYELEDGSVLRVKTVVTKISKMLEDDKKSLRYTSEGEPVYNVRYSVSRAKTIARICGLHNKSFP